jgi:hypothetical protein
MAVRPGTGARARLGGALTAGTAPARVAPALVVTGLVMAGLVVTAPAAHAGNAGSHHSSARSKSGHGCFCLPGRGNRRSWMKRMRERAGRSEHGRRTHLRGPRWGGPGDGVSWGIGPGGWDGGGGMGVSMGMGGFGGV